MKKKLKLPILTLQSAGINLQIPDASRVSELNGSQLFWSPRHSEVNPASCSLHWLLFQELVSIGSSCSTVTSSPCLHLLQASSKWNYKIVADIRF